MDGDDFGPTYQLVVREERKALRWTLLRRGTVVMAGETTDLEDAVRQAQFAAGAHAAFLRIGRRRF